MSPGQGNYMSVDTRELLAKLQRDVEDEFAIYTARGASLDFVQQLVARELCVEMKIVSPTIGAALVELFNRGGWDVSFGTNAVEEQGRFSRWKHLPRRVRRISRRASSNRGSYGGDR